MRRVPAGRAGRLWLQDRLSVARRAVEVLDQKLHLLQSESRRLSELSEVTGEAWQGAVRDARTWLLRSALLDGERGLRLGRAAATATVDITWGRTVGLRHPVGAVFRPPPAEPLSAGASTAQDAAREACVRALEAAVRHAVARGALAAVESEEGATRRRLRAVEQRWVPQLEAEAARVDRRLAEHELGEMVRLRWAVDHSEA